MFHRDCRNTGFWLQHPGGTLFNQTHPCQPDYCWSASVRLGGASCGGYASRFGKRNRGCRAIRWPGIEYFDQRCQEVGLGSSCISRLQTAVLDHHCRTRGDRRDPHGDCAPRPCEQEYRSRFRMRPDCRTRTATRRSGTSAHRPTGSCNALGQQSRWTRRRRNWPEIAATAGGSNGGRARPEAPSAAVR